MIHLRRSVLLLALFACASGRLAFAQTTPTVTQALPNRSLSGAAATSIDLRSHFGLPDVAGSVVQVDTTSGRFNLELFDDTPITKANFLAYINADRYANTVIHRVVPGFVVQMGGYKPILPLTSNHIETFPPIQNEFRRSNVRGTLAMAKVADNPNSATSEWFVNLANNNAANLDNQNGGFTVFARVLGNGMGVVDTIAALPRAGEVPLRDLQPGQTNADERNLVLVNNVFPATIYPPGTRSVLTFTAQSSNAAIVTATISDSTLVLTPVNDGTATVTVRATDTNNASAESTFTVTVSGVVSLVSSPQSQHVQAGAAATFSVASQVSAVTFQWLKDGEPIPGATTPTYTIPNATAADMGFYAVRATISGAGAPTTFTTGYAILTVETPGGSRLINVSTRGHSAAGAPLTPGFVMTGNGTKNLVVRAVGPTLGNFNVPGFLTDPKMDVIPLGQTNVVLASDDWHTAPAAQVAALTATSKAVGAFELPAAGSKDAAALASLAVTGSSGYTVSVTPAGTAAAGVALAEVYDADPANSPTRLINVSTLGAVTADGLTPGFVIGGTSPKRLLIRAVGPTLTNPLFNVTDALADPTLRIVPLGKDFAVATNNDWSEGGQAATLSATFESAGAFALNAGSKDAALVVRLPPGAYTAVATGVAGATGRALVEVYDLDP